MFIFKFLLIALLACVLDGKNKKADLGKDLSKRAFGGLKTIGECPVDLNSDVGRCFQSCINNQSRIPNEKKKEKQDSVKTVSVSQEQTEGAKGRKKQDLETGSNGDEATEEKEEK
ncbi:unnamed protein product [Cylicocyclus nassatus]|uniref:Uncharacterized protein n=1 Tax=Cylicocyclus nassatus TaxID=53992 RepID=A0AA36GDR1_CYLNA|nr:unnamed protein product [Cylicocyclus nassatus]